MSGRYLHLRPQHCAFHPQTLVAGFFFGAQAQLFPIDIVKSRTTVALFLLPVNSLYLDRR